MPFAHRVKPWNFNDKVLSFEDGIKLPTNGEFPTLSIATPVPSAQGDLDYTHYTHQATETP